jgi:four helix bundle protein
LEEEPGVAGTLGWQLLRSGTSIGANLEEAQAGESKLDFICKNAIALKEALETIYWLRLFDEKRLVDIQKEAEELARIVGSPYLVSAKKRK